MLLVLGEEDEDEARRRLYAACQAMQITDANIRSLVRSNLFVLPMAGRPVALTCGDDERAASTADATPKAGGDPADGLPVTRFFWDLLARLTIDPTGSGWSLIILDPLSRFAGLEVETDSAQATRFVQAIERFTAVPGRPTVLVTHHTNKTSRREGQARSSDSAAATAARGSSALTDGVRWQASLEPERRYEGAPELVRFNVVKNNYGRYPPELTLVREDGPLRLATQHDMRLWVQAKAEEKEREESAAAAAKGRAEEQRKPAARASVREENDA